jgi:hypothetical protein
VVGHVTRELVVPVDIVDDQGQIGKVSFMKHWCEMVRMLVVLLRFKNAPWVLDILDKVLGSKWNHVDGVSMLRIVSVFHHRLQIFRMQDGDR